MRFFTVRIDIVLLRFRLVDEGYRAFTKRSGDRLVKAPQPIHRRGTFESAGHHNGDQLGGDEVQTKHLDGEEVRHGELRQ